MLDAPKNRWNNIIIFTIFIKCWWTLMQLHWSSCFSILLVKWEVLCTNPPTQHEIFWIRSSDNISSSPRSCPHPELVPCSLASFCSPLTSAPLGSLLLMSHQYSRNRNVFILYCLENATETTTDYLLWCGRSQNLRILFTCNLIHHTHPQQVSDGTRHEYRPSMVTLIMSSMLQAALHVT